MRKIKYQNWIYEILSESTEGRTSGGNQPSLQPFPTGEGDLEIEKEVRYAVAKLLEKEKIFIEQYYFEGKSYREIGQILKLNLKQVEYLHHKAVFKLKNLLAEFVARRFKMRIEKPIPEKLAHPNRIAKGCVICQNPQQKEIEKVIESKKDYQTWGVILKKLKQKFDLKIKAPQILMGHMKHKC